MDVATSGAALILVAPQHEIEENMGRKRMPEWYTCKPCILGNLIYLDWNAEKISEF